MKIERANTSRVNRSAKPIYEIVEFQRHLMREGLTYSEWAARNAPGNHSTDTVSLALNARYRRLAKR